MILPAARFRLTPFFDRISAALAYHLVLKPIHASRMRSLRGSALMSRSREPICPSSESSFSRTSEPVTKNPEEEAESLEPSLLAHVGDTAGFSSIREKKERSLGFSS